MGKGKLIHSRMERVSIQPPRQKWRVWGQKAGLGLWFTRTFAEPLTGAGDSEETEQRSCQGAHGHPHDKSSAVCWWDRVGGL